MVVIHKGGGAWALGHRDKGFPLEAGEQSGRAEGEVKDVTGDLCQQIRTYPEGLLPSGTGTLRGRICFQSLA